MQGKMKKNLENTVIKEYFGMDSAIMIVIILILFAVFSVVGYAVFDEVNDDLQSDDDLSSDVKADVQNLYDRYPDTLDGAFLTILVLLFIVGLVASLMVDSHPAFLIITLVLMVFLSIAAAFISNTWEEFSNDDDLVAYKDSFPFTNWYLNNFLLVIAVVVVTFGGIVYAKQNY